MKRPIFTLLVLCVFILTGCSPEVTPTPQVSKLTLEPTVSGPISFPAEGGSQTYTVHSSGSNWTATPNWESWWCSVSPTRGKDGEAITITAIANPQGEQRMPSTITVKTETGYILGIAAEQAR